MLKYKVEKYLEADSRHLSTQLLCEQVEDGDGYKPNDAWYEARTWLTHIDIYLKLDDDGLVIHKQDIDYLNRMWEVVRKYK